MCSWASCVERTVDRAAVVLSSCGNNCIYCLIHTARSDSENGRPDGKRASPICAQLRVRLHEGLNPLPKLCSHWHRAYAVSPGHVPGATCRTHSRDAHRAPYLGNLYQISSSYARSTSRAHTTELLDHLVRNTFLEIHFAVDVASRARRATLGLRAPCRYAEPRSVERRLGSKAAQHVQQNLHVSLRLQTRNVQLVRASLNIEMRPPA